MSKNKEPRNDNGQRHGYWERYCAGDLWYKGNYVNGKLVGYEEWYDWNIGKLQEKKYKL